MATRLEQDTMGEVAVPADRYWGAQTQRALENFPIGHDRFPRAFIWALGSVKRACATINAQLGRLPPELAAAIQTAADEVIAGQLDDNFPLVVWQTGSGTQTNMNANEVIANRAIELLGGQRGSKTPVHPNDHVNLGQSSNDVFPTAMHVAVVERLHARLVPQVVRLRASLADKADAFAATIKVGRTHLQDAVPLTVGQELSGYAAQLDHCLAALNDALEPLYGLAIGGTAVGTGLNTHPEFGRRVASELARMTGRPFVPAANRFAALAAHEPLVGASAACRTLARAATKIANDLRLLASGPRCGLGELTLPANEPGSSIMPGKVNPTQIEALTMVACQVIGNDTAIAFAAAGGMLELNVYKPVIVFALLHSIRLLADALESFNLRCVQGLTLNRARLAENLERSLMLVTALAPRLGYDGAAAVAKKAHQEGCSLRQAALALGVLGAEELDELLRPEQMLGPQR